MSGFQVTSLACPGCGASFNGLETDRVFACAACARALEIEAGVKTPFPLRFAPVAVATSLPVVYLPFWRIAVTIDVQNWEGGDAAKKIPVLADLDSVWVGAFFEVRAAYYGNPGLDLTSRGAVMLSEEEVPTGATVVGGGRTLAQAERYAPVFITDIIDKAADVTGCEIKVATGSAEYWAVPFAFDAQAFTLLDLTGGNQYSAAVVENVRNMVRL